ncbi:DsbA family protein [Sporosarcina sp. Te-1]|uniref:DsbA family protein n=1 Tax=Sporosarcina sp. Te-1 TaxID=2818390 RepID=UPI001A9D444C|nr:DsbA family protein [Sporosarcina sp. Te-1]QTD39796.1 thioredoxin domain-containing protein [Sporosarcina sp. Te-1]
MSKKLFWFIGIVAVCIIGIIVLTNTEKESADIDYEGQPFVGDASAPVEIVEFGDYKCPHCKDFNDSLLPIIEKELVETGKAKFYFMNYAFMGPDSTTSAQFAETVYQELGNDVFWEFHHLLFANQTDESGKTVQFTDTVMETLLAEVASPEDVEQVMKAYQEGEGKANLEKDMKTANRLEISSTPSIFINGKLFDGGSMNDFFKRVDEASKSGK